MAEQKTIVIVGLGYVGLPLAVALSGQFDCWGLDIDRGRIAELKEGRDRTGEIETDRLAASTLKLTADPAECPPADIYIVTVPTPVDADNRPDLSILVAATRTVAGMLHADRKPIIVYESTVYPGVTEDVCGVEMERVSGLVRGRDFFLGYSPERINPGDREHTVDRITKVISGENAEVLEELATVYSAMTTGGVYRAKSIKAAEAAKVIENAQRDINIAFMNEITQIFTAMDLSIWDVLDAAGTKWNFLKFQPGFVGGHCIGVDPYYLSHCAQQLGHDARVILSGRSTNDGMAGWAAAKIHEKVGKAGRVLVLGLTFKENVPDLRNSKIADLVGALAGFGHTVLTHDPMADAAEARHEFGIDLVDDPFTGRYDAVILAVPHREYLDMGLERVAALVEPDGLLVDLKNIFPDAGTGSPVSIWKF